MKYSVTNDKNIDREILLKLSDKDFIATCGASSYLRNVVCDDNFFKRRLTLTYPDTLNYNENKNWKSYYLSTIFYIAKMREKYKYNYTRYNYGNPKIQYNILKKVYGSNFRSSNYLLIESSEQGELSIVLEALKRGADIHVDDDLALRVASRNGRLEVVKYLIEHGANIHARNDLALRGANLEVIKYLVEKGADIHAENDMAFRVASQSGNLEVVKYLVEHGANIHANQALKIASQNGHLEVVKYLVEQGADIDIRIDDDLALRAASQNGHLEVVKYLVEHGADPNNRDALIAAKEHNYTEIVRYLESKKKNIISRLFSRSAKTK